MLRLVDPLDASRGRWRRRTVSDDELDRRRRKRRLRIGSIPIEVVESPADELLAPCGIAHVCNPTGVLVSMACEQVVVGVPGFDGTAGRALQRAFEIDEPVHPAAEVVRCEVAVLSEAG